MQQTIPVIIIGGGQAGLSVSCLLKQRDIDHVIFERSTIAHAWKNQRWDSFCLVTPNWQCALPGFPYPGNDPQGFMVRDDIVQYIKDFAASFEPPIREGVEVIRMRQLPNDGGYEVTTTTEGTWIAEQVVVAVGGYHTPTIPAYASRLPASVKQIPAAQYKNPQSLPPGDVLVVGTGQSGCQIAEDLHLAGRRVHLCVGGAPRVARRYRGKDVVEWLHHMGYYEMPVEKHPLKEGVRGRTNHYVTGRDGGRDIDLRKFATEGMQLYSRLLELDGDYLHLGDDLKKNLDSADDVSQSIKKSIDQYIEREKLEAPTEAGYVAPWHPPAEPIRKINWREAGIGSVVWSIGYRSDFRWMEVPIFDGRGYPGHRRGVTTAPGLYFLGLPWLHTWGSGRFSGVARDAEYLADQISMRRQSLEQTVGELDEVALGS